MRRIPAFCVLLAFAVISINCSNSSQQGNAPNDNATGTTTYSNSSVPASSAPATTAAPAGGGASSNSGVGGGTAPKSSPAAPGIKPPTD
ncbi:MAG TPA: hypothetical protein VM095_07300 [Pyrinomonadaceae bacterium]|nr:hypothetical protein [Pyrinomonadaceae bacterium]